MGYFGKSHRVPARPETMKVSYSTLHDSCHASVDRHTLLEAQRSPLLNFIWQPDWFTSVSYPQEGGVHSHYSQHQASFYLVIGSFTHRSYKELVYGEVERWVSAILAEKDLRFAGNGEDVY